MDIFLHNLKNNSMAKKLNSIFKAYLQEYAAEKYLSKYSKIATKKRIVLPKENGLEIALRKKINSRAKGRWPKKKGDLHIFLAYYVSNWEFILPRALSPFGKVTAFNWRERGFDDTGPDWLNQRDEMNLAMLRAFHKADSEQSIDLVVGYLSGYNTNEETLHKMADKGAVIFNFCWDDKLNFPGISINGRYPSPAEIAHAVDMNLTNAPDSLIKYFVHGGLSMFWPEAAHPEIHKSYDIPFEYDVSFVGACYGWRPKFIEKLRKLGVNVTCFGKGWPNGSLSDENMIRLYSKSRINLGFSGIGYSRKLMCLKGRDFEVPMSGGLYLTQNNPELSLVFDIGKEIVTYKDEADCARIISELLANPRLASNIRQAGQKRCLLEHTYEARWNQVLQLAGIIK
ncbi:MAG: hypothetical protein B6I30_10040 [Desulfobacteraceae bacterium 4572_187]|nr:MAG: hypothetical protein B6I30_10040 [Desulfobacteraceae bacterium 4572_187]